MAIEHTYTHYHCDAEIEFQCSIVPPQDVPGATNLFVEEALGPDDCPICGEEFDATVIRELAAEDFIERMTSA